MASIIDFPNGSTAKAAFDRPQQASPDTEPCKLPTTSGHRCEYAIGDLARMLGIAHFTSRVIVDYLRAKVRDESMPLPKTPRLLKGKLVSGPQSIWLQSRWDAERFDAWKSECDGDGPCPPASAALRADLARRAEHIAKPSRCKGAA